MEDYYEYLDSNGVTTLYKLIKDDTVALIDSYSVTVNGITTTLDIHINDSDIHTPISVIEGMIDTRISGLVNSAPETLDTLKELSDALGNDPNFATTVANQIGNKANSVHTHVVSDITDFPTIPTKVSELSNDSNFVTSSELHDYATKNDLNSKQDTLSEEQLSNIDSIPDKANKSDLSTVATSGSYNDLLDKPVIPEGADLSDYYNKGETDNLLNSKANTSDLAVIAKSGSYNDLINTPTIPTKLSQLENDMGFGTGGGSVITSISWTNITDKPNFSTVATSGSYTDLSNTPTIPTKLSQLENDTGFINSLNDVVDTKSNQTINGTKTFTASPFVSNYAVTNGYFTKLNTIARNEVPSQIYHSAFRVFDKNAKTLGEYCVEKSTSGSSLLHMDVHTEDFEGNDIMESLYLNLSNDGSTVSFHPAKNNRTDLGMPHYKWAKVYSDDVVHTSGTETIAGTKTFSNQMYLGGGGTSYGQISAKDNNSILRLFGGTSAGTGANLDLYGENLSNGCFALRARTSDKIVALEGRTDGTLTWGGKNVAIDENLVHRTGNETIAGDKSFSKPIYRKADITTSTVEEVYRFTDTNATPCGSIYNRMHWYNNNVYNRHQAYNATSGKDMYFEVLSHNDGSGVVNTGGSVTNNKNLTTVTSATGSTYVATMGWVNNPATATNVVHRSGDETIAGNKTFSNRVSFPSDYYITTDSNDNSLRLIRSGSGHGNNCKIIIQGDSGKIFAPNGFQGNLQGNADTATSATSATKAAYLDNYSANNANKIYLDWNKQVTGYVGLKVDNTTMGGLITTNNIGSQAANSATYATTQATTDNSTRIATTAWVRTYVNSVAGSNTVGSSVSAYWSNSSSVTATGSSSSGGLYPSCYSEYITKTPTVGTVYSGAQLYTVLNTYASAKPSTTGGQGSTIYVTTTTAQATFSSPISATGKYLCTTANTVKFRAYTSTGSSSSVGTSSVVDNSSTKSIFIRIE